MSDMAPIIALSLSRARALAEPMNSSKFVGGQLMCRPRIVAGTQQTGHPASHQAPQKNHTKSPSTPLISARVSRVQSVMHCEIILSSPRNYVARPALRQRERLTMMSLSCATAMPLSSLHPLLFPSNPPIFCEGLARQNLLRLGIIGACISIRSQHRKKDNGVSQAHGMQPHFGCMTGVVPARMFPNER